MAWRLRVPKRQEGGTALESWRRYKRAAGLSGYGIRVQYVSWGTALVRCDGKASSGDKMGRHRRQAFRTRNPKPETLNSNAMPPGCKPANRRCHCANPTPDGTASATPRHYSPALPPGGSPTLAPGSDAARAPDPSARWGRLPAAHSLVEVPSRQKYRKWAREGRGDNDLSAPRDPRCTAREERRHPRFTSVALPALDLVILCLSIVEQPCSTPHLPDPLHIKPTKPNGSQAPVRLRERRRRRRRRRRRAVLEPLGGRGNEGAAG